MFAFTHDIVEGIGVFLFSGSHNSDADYHAYLDAIARLDARSVGRELPLVCIVIDRGNPPPSAMWRKRIAESTTTLQCKPIVAYVSDSTLVRGAITAVNWLRPPPFEYDVFDTFEAAIAWAEARRGRSCASARSLLEQLRARG